jgi:hypothetical protein
MGDGASYASIDVDDELDYLLYLKNMIDQVKSLKQGNADIYCLELWHGAEFHQMFCFDPETPEVLNPEVDRHIQDLETDQRWTLVGGKLEPYVQLDHVRTSCGTLKVTGTEVFWQAAIKHTEGYVETVGLSIVDIDALLAAKAAEVKS